MSNNVIDFRDSFGKLFNVKQGLKEVFSIKADELKIGGIFDILTKEQRGTLIKNFSFRGIDYENSCDAKIFADSYNCFLGIKYYEHDRHKKAYVVGELGKIFDSLIDQVITNTQEFMFVDDSE